MLSHCSMMPVRPDLQPLHVRTAHSRCSVCAWGAKIVNCTHVIVEARPV